MAFSFIHMADVHFDTPFASKDSAFRKFMRESARLAFKAGVDLALKKKVNALLIVGDLFDNNTLSFATEKFLIQQLNRLKEAGINVYYSPGNHDPWGSNYRLSQIPWPSNVHIFKTSEPETVAVVDEEGSAAALITAAGHEGSREGRNLAAAFPECASQEIPHIGLLHTMVTGLNEGEHEKYAPSTLADLIQKGYTYWALGHVHARKVLSENPLIVYPGNLIGRNPRETGPKGAYLVEAGMPGQVKASFHTLAPVCWHEIKVNNLSDVHDLESLEKELFNSITEYLDESTYSGEPLLKIYLEGPTPLYSELLDEDNLLTLSDLLRETLNLRFLEISGERLVRQADPGLYHSGPHLLSEVLSLLDKSKTDEDLLLKLAPDSLAGNSRGLNKNQKLEYLLSLLEGLEYEAVARLVEGDEKE